MTKYNKRIGDSIGCDWREEFCGKVEQIMGFLRGRLRADEIFSYRLLCCKALRIFVIY